MEYVSGGELFHFCQYAGPIGEVKGFLQFKQIVKGVKYLHDQGISHRDLRLENLILDDKTIKITDFGFAVN